MADEVGSVAADANVPWRIGDRVDACDCEGVWYDSVVLDTCTKGVLVHYMGWESKWDAWVSLPKVAPLWSKVYNWRAALAVGDCVEMRHGGSWHCATVTFRCDKTSTVWLVAQRDHRGPLIYGINSNDIAWAGVHCSTHNRARHMRFLWLKSVAAVAADQVEAAWQEAGVNGLLLPVVLADALRVAIPNASSFVIQSELALVIALYL